MKGMKIKQVLSVGGGRVSEEGEGEQIWCMYFVYMYIE
jgi:hypothetical protein